MYQRTELFSTLSSEDIASTLSACTLPDKQEYTESEADRFRECRELIGQGKNYQQVTAHFRRIDKNLKQIAGEDGVDEAEAMLEISELLALASSQCETRISLKEAAVILDSCGLPDTEFYTSQQGDRFLEACELIKQQGKTYEEVMTHFGVKSDPPTLPSGMQQLLKLLDNSVLSADEKLSHLVNKITAHQADQTDIHQLVQWSYLKNVSRQLIENNNTNALFDALNQRLEDYIEGKPPAQSQRTFGDWEPISLPKLSPKLMSLPEGSDNGTSDS